MEIVSAAIFWQTSPEGPKLANVHPLKSGGLIDYIDFALRLTVVFLPPHYRVDLLVVGQLQYL